MHLITFMALAGSVLALNHQTDMMRITAPAVLGEAALLRDFLPAAAERPFTFRYLQKRCGLCEQSATV